MAWAGGGLVWIVGPTYKAAEEEMRYLYRWFGSAFAEPMNTPTDSEWRLVLRNGTVIETRSAGRPERLASVAPDLIIATEAGQMSPSVRTALQGRALEHNAPIIYGGTLETDDNKPQYAWYEQLASAWMADPSPDHAAISLPSWANRAIFPGGEHDPKIEARRRALDPFTFARGVAGQPSGAAHPAYPQLQGTDAYLMAPPAEIEWTTSVGGADWGIQHPWALVVVSVSDLELKEPGDLRGYGRQLVWVRECVWSGPNNGDTAAFDAARLRLARKYNIHRWGVDPNQTYMAGRIGAVAVKGSAGARDERIGYIRSRLNNKTLYFDPSGDGVRDLYTEARGVRYRVTDAGKYELVRLDDDRTAALEDAVEVLDARPVTLPRVAGLTYLPRTTRREKGFRPA